MTRTSKKSLLAIAYMKKYSFPNKVIYRKIGAFEKLTKLIKRGKSEIYLCDITKSYTKAYESVLFDNRSKSYMKRLGYTATLDPQGRTYYGSIDYVNGDPGSVINEEISNLEKFARLIKRGESEIYLGEIKKSYTNAYGSVLSDKRFILYEKTWLCCHTGPKR